MNNTHDPLDVLLKQWQAPEPPGDFEQNVMRRIRLQHPSPSRSWLETLGAGIMASAVALIVAMVITRGSSPQLQNLLRPESVTGGYAQLFTGDTR